LFDPSAPPCFEIEGSLPLSFPFDLTGVLSAVKETTASLSVGSGDNLGYSSLSLVCSSGIDSSFCYFSSLSPLLPFQVLLLPHVQALLLPLQVLLLPPLQVLLHPPL